MGFFFKKVKTIFVILWILEVGFYSSALWAKSCDIYGEKIDYSYFNEAIELRYFKVLFNSSGMKLEEVEVVKYQHIAEQLQAAEMVYNDIFNMKGLNNRERYENVNQVFVFIKDMEKYNGLVLSRSVGGVLGDGGCILRMNINKNISNRNLTPAHELFHFYHFSITSINRPWLREGLARWAMHIFSGNLSSGDVLPENMEQMEVIFQESYRASSFWVRLVSLLDRSSDIPIDSSNRFRKYKDGSAVVNGDVVIGGKFIRDLFFKLSERNRELSEDLGKEWFRDKNNNHLQDEVIFEAIKEVVIKYNSGSQELKNFLLISN
ncbi:MAG TPA: hypothetical protein PLS00_08795 [Niabella sp.]|nr:hypothetical protein [Niabella sp.]